MTSRGLAPELPLERATTVAAPPERWFLGNSANPTGVDLLRQAHARLPLRAATGASEPTTTCYGTVGGLRTLGQNMVTEMGQGWTDDISRFVLKYGSENIIPFSRLHAEASRSGQPLNSPPNVLDVLRHIRDQRGETGSPRSAVPQLRLADGSLWVSCAAFFLL